MTTSPTEPDRSRRAIRLRVTLWATSVLSVVILVVIQGAFPDWTVLPFSLSPFGAGGFLMLFGAALVCEFIDSSLGMGYGTTLTPLLLLAGFAPLEVVPCVLLSELITGLTAGIMHHRDGNVDLIGDRQVLRTLLLLSVLSAIGAVAAVTLAIKIPKIWLGSIIAIIILSVGVITLATLRHRFRYRSSHIVTLGAVAAFNKGLSGGGYGPLVTAGQVVSGLTAKQAVAVTSLAESFTCLVGLIAYLVVHGTIAWSLAIPLTTGAMLSVPLATLMVARLHETHLRAGVGVVTCLLAVLTLVRLFT